LCLAKREPDWWRQQGARGSQSWFRPFSYRFSKNTPFQTRDFIFSIFAKKKVLSQIDLVIHQLCAGGVSEEIRVITYTKNVHEDVGFSKESTFPSKTSLSRGSQNPYEPFLIFRNFMKLGSVTPSTHHSRPNYDSKKTNPISSAGELCDLRRKGGNPDFRTIPLFKIVVLYFFDFCEKKSFVTNRSSYPPAVRWWGF